MVHIHRVAQLLPLVVLVGCTAPRTVVEERQAEWQAHDREEQERMVVRPQITLDWETARTELLRSNPELLTARVAIRTADGQIDRVWLDLLPATSVAYSVNRGMTQLGSGEEGQLSIFAFANIPGLISTRMRYVGAVLSKVRSEYAYDLTVRTQTLALWTTFRDARRLQDRQAWAKLARSRNLLTGVGGTAALSELLGEHAIQRERDALQDRIGKLLGDMSKEYRFNQVGLPAPDYRANPLDIQDTKKVGLLAMKLAATELEGGRLRKLGATLAFWPDVSVGISGPPVFQHGPQGSTGWSASDARAYAAVTWRLDTQLNAVYSLNETKRQLALMHNQIRLQNQERIRRLQTTRTAMETLRRRAADVDRRLTVVMGSPPATDFNTYAAWSNELRSLILEREQLNAESDGHNAVFWFADESRWSVTHPDSHEDADDAEFEAMNSLLDKHEK